MINIADIWQNSPDVWSFVLCVLAMCVFVLVSRGPTYMARYTAHIVAMREQDRLDRSASLTPEVANEGGLRTDITAEIPLPLRSSQQSASLAIQEKSKAA